ncbi:hypothetical protein [Nocardia wallacei]|uniref:hypothetical protein n=1 Tax=Nocardia wallacei TaxID=480035 RepID=UPI0024581E69|nr:hypothetical protein [Nocardia wallacei]
MKTLHTAPVEVQLKMENTALRREIAELRDELAASQAEVRNLLRAAERALDDAAAYQLLPDAERLIPRPQRSAWQWSHWDTSTLDTEQAHAAMQQHLNCTIEDCPRRASAVQTLIDAGHLKPDSHRPGHRLATPTS